MRILALALGVIASPAVAGTMPVVVARAPAFRAAPSAPARPASPAQVKLPSAKPLIFKPASAAIGAVLWTKMMTHGAVDDVEGVEVMGCDVDRGC